MLNFFKTLIPSVLFISLFVNTSFAQGPNSPEAQGFEPADATDMVNITNGNLTYVLPLLNMNGYPISLSYHAGISPEMEASWVGLGWYLNPGSLTRGAVGTPDDWKSGVGINFTSYNETQVYHSISAGIGVTGTPVSVAIGANWGGGQGLVGTIQYNLLIANIYADTRGNISGGVGLFGNSMSFSNNSKPNYSLGYMGPLGGGNSGGFSYSDDGTVSLAGGTEELGGVGISFNGSGNFSIGAVSSSGAGGSLSISSNNQTQGDATIETESLGLNVIIPIGIIDIRLGFGRQKVNISIKKGYENRKWGALYSNHYYGDGYAVGTPKIYSVANSNELDGFNEYMVRYKQLDSYSTRIPQPEEEFIGDYSKQIENINFTYIAYDNYNVSAQGLMGSLTPRVFQNANILGKGDFTTNEDGDDIHVFWHHGHSTNRVQRSLNNSTFNFYFDGNYSGIERNTANATSASVNSSSSTLKLNDFVNEGSQMHNGTIPSTQDLYTYRANQGNFVEVFTNIQIANGASIYSPEDIPISDRLDTNLFDPYGIGGYKITAADGKTYHFSIPVYHYERVRRGQIEEQERRNSGVELVNDSFYAMPAYDCKNVNEVRDYTRYATHWLLTAITGPDYIDRPDANNETGTFNKEDYGYWIEFEYGKWSDGFVWRTPYQDFVYDYNTNIKGNVEEKDKGNYQFGRKQIYYLDKIISKDKTALFIKDKRLDAYGKALNYAFTNVNNSQNSGIGNSGDNQSSTSLRYTDPNVHVKEIGVFYEREYSLKLDKIVLIDTDKNDLIQKGGVSDLYNGFPGYIPNDVNAPGWQSPDFRDHYNNGNPGYQYVLHQEGNVLDIGDIPTGFLSNDALKVINFNYSYDLVQDTPSSKINGSSFGSNSEAGRLTLNSVEFRGRGNISHMPPTEFSYYRDLDLGSDWDKTVNPNFLPLDNIDREDIETHIELRKNFLDSWGYMQEEYLAEDNTMHTKAELWSLKQLQTPTGATIQIDYEEDDYWTEAFSRRYWEKYLSVKVTRENPDGSPNNNGSEIKVRFKNNPDVSSSFHVEDFNDYFEIGERVFLDLYYCFKENDNDIFDTSNNIRGAVDIREDDFVTVEAIYDETTNGITQQILLLDVQDTGTNALNNINTCGIYGDENPHHALNKWAYDDNHPRNDQLVRCECPDDSQSENRYSLLFKLLANKVPTDETGGGLRVKQIVTTDPLTNSIYKAEYDYTNPQTGKTSGITSYAPVNGMKYVPYQSEVPPPGVMYEYVTMKETGVNGETSALTRYRHHVLEPLFNIFNPELELDLKDADAPEEDKIFWANVEENTGGLDGNNAKKIEAKKIDLHINTALFGQLKSIEILNTEGQVMNKIEHEYSNGSLLGTGYVKETFNSMKSIFKSNDDGTVVYDNDTKRLLSISSRTEYKNLKRKTKSTSGGISTSIEHSDIDPWLGSFRKSIATTAKGEQIINYKVPAYEKYPEMGSKVLDPSNKNMLTQQEMSITKYRQDDTSPDHTISATISTWNKNWTYLNNDGTVDNSDNTPIYRKHQNYIWKDDVKTLEGTAVGAYETDVDESNDYFNWTINDGEDIINEPTIDSKWEKVSEITQYNHWSSPQESKDINENFVSSKMADNNTKVIVSGNARFTELYYTGAEYVESGNMFEGGVLGANFRNDDIAHTGKYSVKNNSYSDNVFELSGNVSSSFTDFSQNFRPGTYKVSFWKHNYNEVDSAPDLYLNSSQIPHSESVRAGCWTMYNYYVELQPNSSFTMKVNDTGNNYFDDFRMHPVYASVNSFVYDLETDDLTYILDGNNMGSAFRYDNIGRLKTTYSEVASDQGLYGGFKITQQYKMHYQNYTDVTVNFNENINTCIELVEPPVLNFNITRDISTNTLNSHKISFIANSLNGSGNYLYEWSWLIDKENKTFSDWTTGSAEQLVPYAVNYCNERNFNKEWEAKLRVTDLVSNQQITKSLIYTDRETGECNNIIDTNNSLLGIEVSEFNGTCFSSFPKLKMYALDSNIVVNTPMGYKDNNADQFFNLDIYSTDGTFCPQIKYVPSNSCESGYVGYVSITTHHNGLDALTYDFYIDCLAPGEVESIQDLIEENHEETRYNSPGTILIKEDGKTISVNQMNQRR